MAPSETDLQNAKQLLMELQPVKLREPAARVELLRHMLEVFVTFESAFCQAISADFGRPSADTRFVEIFPMEKEFEVLIDKTAAWSRPTQVHTPLHCWPSDSEVGPEPLGRVFVIAPWNFPLMLSLQPAIDAIAAGNAVLIRPSSSVPHFAEQLTKYAEAVDRPEFFKVHSCGHNESDALVSCGAADFIFYTGSPNIGKHVAQLAAQNLTPIVLELGGKSPTIVAQDADLELTAERVMWARFLNAGQICVCPDYVLCHESCVDDLAAHCLRVASRRLGGSEPDASLMSLEKLRGNSAWRIRIVNKSNAQRLQDWLREAEGVEGVKILCGGAANCDPEQRLVAPTVVVFPSLEAFNSTQLGKEEIFGPVVPIVPIGSINEAIDYVNSRPKPLALYAFTRNMRTARMIADNTSSGQFMNNDVLMSLANHELPFGGVGNSGYGSYHGHFGFTTLSHVKARVFRPHAAPTAMDPRLSEQSSGYGRVARMALSHLGINVEAAKADDEASFGQ